MAITKALIPGVILTLLASAILAARGASNTALALEHTSLGTHHFYWSWPLFLVATGLMSAFVWVTDSK